MKSIEEIEEFMVDMKEIRRLGSETARANRMLL